MSRYERFYLILAALFCVIAVVANFIAAKLVLWGSATFSAGLLIYPITFLISDLVTEIYGKERARLMIYLGFCMCIIATLLSYLTLWLPPYEVKMQAAFVEVFGNLNLFVAASLMAYVLAQFLDVFLYSKIREATGDRFMWLRSNGATLISQAVDTLIVTSVTFGWGFGFSWDSVMHIMFYSYLYKAAFVVIMTPVYYLSVYAVRKEIS